MADVALTIGMRDDATPVLKGIKTSVEQTMSAVQAAMAKADGAVRRVAQSVSAIDVAQKKATGALAESLGSIRTAADQYARLGDAGVESLESIRKAAQDYRKEQEATNKVISAGELSTKKAFGGIKPGVAAVASEFAGLGGAAGLAASSAIAFLTATGPLGVALAALTATAGFLVYRIQQARERMNELAEIELAKIARDDSFLKLEQDIRNAIRAADAGPNKIRQITLEMDRLRVQADKANDPKILQLVDRLQRSQISNVIREARQSIQDQTNAVQQQVVELTRGVDAADQYALSLARGKAINEGFGTALEAANRRLNESQRQLKDLQFIKSLVDQRDALAAQRKELVDGAGAADDFRFSIMAANLELQVGQKSLDDARNALAAYRAEQIALRAAQFGEQVKQLEAQVTGEVLSEVSGRIAAAQKEYDERIKLIDRWKDAMERAGKDVTDQANRLTGLAAESLQNKTDPAAQLKQKLQRIDIQAEILGPDFDSIQPKIQAITDTLIDLAQRRQDLAEMARLGFVVDPDEILRIAAASDVLKQKLEDFKQFQKVKEAVDGIADGIAGAWERALNSTGSALDRLKGFVNDVLSTINRELTKLLVTDPLKEWLKGQLGGILGKVGLPVPGPNAPAGGAGNTAGIAAIQATQTTAVTAIQAASTAAETAATTAIQTQGTTSQTAIQAEQTAAEVAIQSTQSTAQIGIEAVKDAALAAIEAASAQGGGGGGSPMSSIPFIGSFFGGSSAGAGYGEAGFGFGSSSGAATEAVAFAHSGGVIGRSRFPTERVPTALFRNASRYHMGGDIGSAPGDFNLKPGEVPFVGKRGERVLTEDQWNGAMNGKGRGDIHYHANVTVKGATDYPSYKRSEGQIISSLRSGMRRSVEKGFSR